MSPQGEVPTFVTNKVVKTTVQIKKRLKDKLVLGNLDSFETGAILKTM